MKVSCVFHWLMTAVLFLSGCSQYATVKENRRELDSVLNAPGLPASARPALTSALQFEAQGRPLECIGCFLSAVDACAVQLRRNPSDEAALRTYNYALSRIFDTMRKGNLNPWSQPMRAPAAGGDYRLTVRPDKRSSWNPARYDFLPCDQLEISGSYTRTRTAKPGLGAPLVAVEREIHADAERDLSLPKNYYGVTAIARFKGRNCELAIEDPLAVEYVQIGGRTFPLAADFSAPLALMLNDIKPRKLELARLVRPGSYTETARIVRLEPFDPDKTVVLVVHGLMDSPATWVPMINTLRGDPEIRRNFQFWYYGYPSGYPYPHSAAILRKHMDVALQRFPVRKPLVLIGHSMGGIISRLMITDSGDKLWMEMFGKPPGQTQMSESSRRILTDALIFKSRPEVGRVIFIASPHKGSEIASNWVGRLGSELIHAPQTLMNAGAEALKIVTFNAGDLQLEEIPNSVDTLAPNSRFVKAVARIPVRSGTPFHSIIGDRGKGNTPDSTDGFVPYWSSHMEGAKSELIVPSGHSAHQNPEAIAEVRRILLLHQNRG